MLVRSHMKVTTWMIPAAKPAAPPLNALAAAFLNSAFVSTLPSCHFHKHQTKIPFLFITDTLTEDIAVD